MLLDKSGKLLTFTSHITLLCVFFQGVLLPVTGLIPKSYATAVNESSLPAMPLPPQNVVNSPSDLTTAYPGVPTRPTAPKPFKKPDVKDAFHCERQFLYKGETYGCDSFVQRDAERLRLIVADVPEATQEIDTYQRNRKNVMTAAYIGSVGLVALIGGFFVSRAFTDSQGNLNSTGISVRSASVIGGTSLIIGAVGFGFFALHNNESHIDNAVSYFNKAHPSTPITLQFSTRFSL